MSHILSDYGEQIQHAEEFIAGCTKPVFIHLRAEPDDILHPSTPLSGYFAVDEDGKAFQKVFDAREGKVTKKIIVKIV